MMVNRQDVVNGMLNDAWEFKNEAHTAIGMLTSSIVDICLYILYCVRWQIPFKVGAIDTIHHDEGSIAYDLQKEYKRIESSLSSTQKRRFYYLVERLLHAFCNYSPEAYNGACYTVARMIIQDGESGPRWSAVNSQPEELLKVVSHILNQLHSQSIYNPYAGIAMYSRGLSKGISYFGQEIDEKAVHYARLLAAFGSYDNFHIEQSNPLYEWKPNHFDAVVSMPPFYLRLNSRYDMVPASTVNWDCRTIEDYIFTRSFETNKASNVITIEPIGFCVNSQYLNLRKYLVEQNYIDAIVALPENIFLNTNISTVLVICRKGRAIGEPVRFVDATKMCNDTGITKNRPNRCTLDAASVIAELDGGNSMHTSYVTLDEIREKEYSFAPILYRPWTYEAQADEIIVPLRRLLTPLISTRVDANDVEMTVPTKLASRDFIEVLLTKDKIVPTDSNSNRNIRRVQSECPILVVTETYINRYLLYVDKHTLDIPATAGVRMYAINTELVTPDYMVYLLLNNANLQDGKMPLSTCLYLSVPILKNQQQQSLIVDNLKQEYAARVKREQEADAARLNVRLAQSDLMHMLGTPFAIQTKLISRISKYSGDKNEPKFADSVKALMDVTAYIHRITKAMDGDFSHATYVPKIWDFGAFLSDYFAAWNNYAFKEFHVTLSLPDSAVNVKIDDTLFMILLDTAMDNARRHGFGKNNVDSKNEVALQLCTVSFNDEPFALLTIANNGAPFDDNFDIHNFIYRGRFNGTSGRTGLGGNHIYAITKKHGGYLAIRHDDTWGFMLDILLPLCNMDSFNDLYVYDYETV